METPVYDFVQKYVQRDGVRLHMPGHKGHSFLGCELLDITEIAGADVLSESSGILGISQRNASALFGTGATLYSTEGSSLCIKVMLATVLVAWKERQRRGDCGRQGASLCGEQPWILTARNVHRAMVDGCALLDLELRFIPSSRTESICSAKVTAESVEDILSSCTELPVGVYITSPDYLGVQSDIAAISAVCHRYGLPLLVDNAHGAYLAFLRDNRHPIAQGADICCDSAHKTLPVLTGGAYLHLSRSCAGQFAGYAARMRAVFGSTSPSYLVLQSLDLCNRYLADGYPDRLEKCIRQIEKLKKALEERGIAVQETEPLKIVIDTNASGYRGLEIARELREFTCINSVGGIECEYADDRFLVFMMTPENRETDFESLWEWMKVTKLNEKKKALTSGSSVPSEGGRRRMSVRQALLSDSEMVPVCRAVGRILAQETVSCPPAIPIGISGEEVTAEMAELFQAYGIQEIAVVACNV